MFVVLIFLVKITGIPYTEQNALRTTGDAYKEYQRTTSAFLLLPPKKSSL
jgi:steroid 5-alpha reductase family enzyme